MPPRPVTRLDGHLPIEDHGLIGDGATCALVGRDGSIPWLCLPDFDSRPFLAGLLDAERGGSLTVAPAELRASAQHYLGDTGVLVTELHGPDGVLEVTDCLTLRTGADLGELVPPGRGELLRLARVVSGTVEVDVRLRPLDPVQVTREAGGWRVHWPARADLPLALWCSHGLEVARDGSIGGRVTLSAGEQLTVALHWSGSTRILHRTDPAQLVDRTVDAWERWAGRLDYQGPQRDLVRRSAVTLKLLDHAPTGAIMAAATSSLPEALGGERNWDYRYTWVRDAAFSTYALRRIGMTSESESFLAWTLANAEREGGVGIMYALDGRPPSTEWQDVSLAGYRGSGPVRWGNGAAGQHQHDVYGELLDVAWQWVGSGGRVDEYLWTLLCRLTEQAVERWETPDHGIWEIRDTGRPFTYSVALCCVAVDRALRIAEHRGLPHPRERWRAELDRMRAALLDRAWDPDRQTFTEHLADAQGRGRGGLDGSLLALPLRRVVAADDPRMVATTEAVRRELDAGDGLLYRYLHTESPDGLEGQEGAFLLCSFWLVDNLTGQGRLEEAHDLYDRLCARASETGLLAEEVDPTTGAFLGNVPQAFSHVGVISSGWALARAGEGRR
ncbi:glycoside hydrolase family 15 protein [Geodermatophilus sp. DSM 45219]|uniref:glycoside hydrolase family 15 protein n=1 Tax=Geodermatophilus sp. DSM 45219 TaxID=1881103 RepID=UPI00088684B8|nr:glycoside hydrolase family 15 protein [Geodermatophilus sp. DSM 45219]SDO06761.1 Glucoamylase (glucan-1,4-alpha-glucosidase), GH15 family [Geodermatophilus sp. DSM 45219]